MAQTAMKITPVEKLSVWVLTDNFYDTLRPSGVNYERYHIKPPKSVHAEHGVAFYIETVTGGKTHACMFDFGLDAAGIANNIALLGLDLGKVNAFGLSHGHYDHFTSATKILKENRDRIARGTPFYAGEEAFARRFTLRPGQSEAIDLGQLSRQDIEALGLKVVEVSTPAQIIPGAYFTGNIARVTSYEKVPPTNQVLRGETMVHDLFPGEQGLFFNVKDKGLVVISGCAHAGIVNTVKQAQSAAGTRQVHAVMGGFHLSNAKPELIASTVAGIKAMDPDYVVPMHCTGFEAVVELSRQMPDKFILNTAGTRYTFTG